MQDFGYYSQIIANLQKVNETQEANIDAAASLMTDAIAEDRLIHVYGGGGHTTLPVGEMFFRAGGLANIDPGDGTGAVGLQSGVEIPRTRAHGQFRRVDCQVLSAETGRRDDNFPQHRDKPRDDRRRPTRQRRRARR